jgi:transposase
VKPVEVPWARPGSGFTLLFEAWVLHLAAWMPVTGVAEQVREHDTRIWRVLQNLVEKAREKRDDSTVTHVAMDETAARRGHRYVTLFADAAVPRVLFVTEGKGADTVKRFTEDFKGHGGDPERVTEACCDMSAAFIRGITDFLPKASITFDKFHVVKLVNDAVDKTRREERHENPELKGHRYTVLRNIETMSDDQLEFGATLLLKRSHLKTARAFHLRLAFQEFYEARGSLAEATLRRWCSWAQRSRVPEMVRVARTIRQHWSGILRWFQSRITNGMMEAINGLVQAAKARARGYRTTRNLATIIYLIAGKLDLQVTH